MCNAHPKCAGSIKNAKKRTCCKEIVEVLKMAIETIDTIILDVKTTSLSLIEVIKKIEALKVKNPDAEYFLDGDTHTIIERRDPSKVVV